MTRARKFTFAFFIAAIACLPFSRNSQAQDPFKDYQPLESQGIVPEDFWKLSTEKFKEDKNTIDKNQQRSERKTKEDFYLRSNFQIDEVLLSGRVLFNDPVSTYLNKIADVLLKDDPGLRKQLRFYAAKVPITNAFTTNNGIVLVNIGLISQMENEAQLAYILAHEIIHFKNQHVINSYIENKRIERTESGYGQTGYEQQVLAKSAYSKELEFEADLQGLKLFLKSDYSINSLNGVFDILQYSYLPFEEVTFEKSFFETENLVFPESYLLEEISPVGTGDDFDDSKSSHPSTSKRREVILEEIEGLPNDGRVEFLVSEVDFYTTRETARFEAVRYYVQSLDYPNAIYNAFLLLRNHPDNKFLEMQVAKALYATCHYKAEGQIADVVIKHQDIEGEMQQLHYFLRELSGRELSILSTSYAWNLQQKHPENAAIRAVANDMLQFAVTEYDLKKSDFFDSPQSEQKAAPNDSLVSSEKTENSAAADSSSQSQYEKINLIKKNKSSDETSVDEAYYKYAFVDLLQYDSFSKQFEKAIDSKPGEVTWEERKAQYRQESRSKKIIKRRGRALDLDKIVIVDPYYKKIDQRKRDAVRLVRSEAKQQEFVRRLNKNADLAGLSIDILDSKSFNSSQVDQFNDYALLNDWANERFSHENIPLSISDREYVKPLIEKYGTKYFAWTGVLNLHVYKVNSGYYFLLSALSPPLFPLALLNLVAPKYETYYFFFLFDIESGEAIMVEREYIREDDRLDVVNSHLYDSFHQIKRDKN